MKHMYSTWNLFVLPLGYLAVIIPEFEQSSVTPRWEMKHGHEFFGQTVYVGFSFSDFQDSIVRLDSISI